MASQDITEDKLSIICGDTVFEFPLSENDDAWYSLDGREAAAGHEKLVLDADREVYAVYTDSSGARHYGTIGDEENETEEDNYPISAGERYIFYENPRTEKYYV